MKLRCDVCYMELGTFLYGPGGIHEVAFIGQSWRRGMPDIVCKNKDECYRRADRWSLQMMDSYPTKTIDLSSWPLT